MGCMANGRTIHAVDVDAVDAVVAKVDNLLASVVNARLQLSLGALAGGHKTLDHLCGNGGAAVERHALQLLDAGKGHDAAHDGHLDAPAVAQLAEAIEVVVVLP